MKSLPQQTGDIEGCDESRSAQSLAKRFWPKVHKGEADVCWPWMASGTTHGYGRITYKGKAVQATHASWFLRHGVWPSDVGLHALHSCDNPSCVNAAHLYLGTHDQNMRDKVDRGRASRLPLGEGHPLARLTEDDVRAIRELSRAGWIQKRLAARFGVSPATIGKIVRRETWTHI